MSEFFGSVDAINIGGHLFTDMSNYKVVHGAAGTDYEGLKDHAAATQSGYLVAANTAFEMRVARISQIVDGASNNVPFIIGYSDDNIGFQANTQGANATYFLLGATTSASVQNSNGFGVANFYTNTSNTMIEYFVPLGNMRVPASKYPIVKWVNTTLRCTIDVHGVVVNV